MLHNNPIFRALGKQSAFFLRILKVLVVSFGLSPVVTLADGRDSLRQVADSTKPVSIVHVWQPAWQSSGKLSACHETGLTWEDCMRHENSSVLVLGSNFPGQKIQVWDRTTLQALVINSPYTSVSHSSYGAGGFLSGPWEMQPFSGISENWVYPGVLDSPQTDLYWSRGPFASNFFRLHFIRKMNENIYLGLDYGSNKSDKTDDFEYNFQVPLAYVGLPGGRDSSELVIGSHFPKVDNNEIRPRLGFLLGSGSVLELFFDRYSNESENAWSFADTIDRDGYTESMQRNIPDMYSATSTGALWVQPLPYGDISARSRLSWYNKTLWGPRDTLAKTMGVEMGGGEQELEIKSHWGVPEFFFELNINSLWNQLDAPIYSRLSAMRDSVPSQFSTKDDNVQKITTSWDLQKGQWHAKLLGGAARYQTVREDAEFLPLWLADLKFKSSYTWAQTSYEQTVQAISLEKKYWSEPGRGFLPSPDNSQSSHRKVLGLIGVGSPRIYTEGWMAYSELNDVPLPRRLPAPRNGVQADTMALISVPYDESRLLWGAKMVGSIWGFRLEWENGFLLDNVLDGMYGDSLGVNSTLPSWWARGSFEWKAMLVDHKLDFRTGTSWTWLNSRYAWAYQDSSTVKPIKLDEYIMMDVWVRMKIRSFTLIYEIRNLYDDRYYHEPGSHPPGVTFRYAIEWGFKG